MQAIIFCGIQASGKSTFYQQNFFHTHVRISLDLLRTRHRESKFLRCCLDTQQRFVVDNTNPTKLERQRYVELAKRARYEVHCYYFESDIQSALLRNNTRTGKQLIPIRGIYGTRSRLEVPTLAEGFDKFFIVKLLQNGQYEVQEEQQEL